MKIIKFIICIPLVVFIITANAAYNIKANNEKNAGNMFQFGYQPQPLVLSPNKSFLNPARYRNNTYWRQIMYSGGDSQIVFMNISPMTNPENEVPNENHDMDQYIFILSGTARVVFNHKGWSARKTYNVSPGYWVLIPRGFDHYIKNTTKNNGSLKIVSFYSRYDSAPGTIHRTLAEEMGDQGTMIHS